MSSHALEARLRAEWRAYTDEVARFQPEKWRAAVAWTAYLVDLPVVDHLRHGGRLHRWMAEDGIYAPWSGTDPHERERALKGSPLAALAHETASAVSTVVTWLDVWRRLWPNTSAAHSRALESIVRTVGEHVALLDSPAATSSSELRTALSQRLSTLFRRHFETAAAAIAHLLLEALDLERVRAALVRRVLVEPLRPDAA